jgi:eukaryotic-like serine/threonine-protein kinase
VTSSASEESGSSTAVDVNAARKYQVLMELGRGGTAIVSAGIARGIGGFTKLVVLKNIKEEFLTDRDTVRMFVNEARLSARMNHPNVVQVYEVSRQNRLPVIVMEYLDGQSLARVLPRAYKDPAYSTDLAIGILCRVLAGLHYAHKLADYDGRPLDIVHRDVSPHNVMITYDGQVKLVDFGIAKLNSSSDETQTGVIKGKIGYMAPEQVEGVHLDQRCDVFAAGVMLWEMVARERLWGARSDADIVRSLVLDDVPSLASRHPSIDPELCGICARAMACNADERYASAHDFQTDLETYLSRRGVVVRQEDIAELICRACADLQAASGERLQAELAKFAASAPGWEDAMRAFEELRTPLPESTPSTGLLWRYVACALLAAASATGVYLWVLPTQKPEPGLVAERELAVAPIEAAPARVRLSLTVTPPSAAVTLDGQTLASSPLSLSLPRDDREHELSLSADGYAPMTRRLRLDADAVLELTLEPLPHPQPAATTEPSPGPSPDPAARRGRQRRPASAPPPKPRDTAPPQAQRPPGPARVDCNPPYYIGDDGLKHYRRECL